MRTERQRGIEREEARRMRRRYLVTIEVMADEMPDVLDIDLSRVFIEAAQSDLNAEAIYVVSIEEASA